METQAYLWHYITAGVIFAVIGAIGHVCRAVFNFYPDRLSDKTWMDMLVSDGYNLGDYLFGPEYDDAGYYKLDSFRNLRGYVLAMMIGGWAAMLLVPGLSGLVAEAINQSLLWVWRLFLYRLSDVRFF